MYKSRACGAILLWIALSGANAARVDIVESQSSLMTEDAGDDAGDDLALEGETQEKCAKKMDIVFVVDGSGSVSNKEWKKMKQFIFYVARGLKLSTRYVKMGIIQFANQVKVHTSLASSLDSIKQTVRRMKQMKGGTDTAAGLLAAKRMLQTDGQRRSRVKNIVILVADGDAGRQAETNARNLEKDWKANIYSIAAGHDADHDQLERLASSPDMFYEIDEFDGLFNIVDEINDRACHEETVPPRTYFPDRHGGGPRGGGNWGPGGGNWGPGGGNWGPGGGNRGGDGGNRGGDGGNRGGDGGNRGGDGGNRGGDGGSRGGDGGNRGGSDGSHGGHDGGSHGGEGGNRGGDAGHGGQPGAATIPSTTPTTSTTWPELCALQETHKKFIPRYDHWTLLAALGERLTYESQGKILQDFMRTSSKVTSLFAHRSSSPLKYARAMATKLRDGAHSVGFEAARRTQAEVQDYVDLGLARMEGMGTPEQQATLETLQTSLCEQMRTFIQVTTETEQSDEFYRLSANLWNAWQLAWGPVRIFVKVTTQCRPVVPPDENFHVFLGKPELWTQCASVDPWAESEFPSAVMACARPDGEHVQSGGVVMDRDRMVRYLGCGGNRLKTPSGGHIEPPVVQGVSEACSANSAAGKDFMTALCGPGSVTTGGCRMYGPFWSIYSAPLETQYGKKEVDEDEDSLQMCPLEPNGDEDCADPQVEAFKGMGRHAGMDYIYGALPPLTMSRARAWRDGKDVEGWEDHMNFPFPEQRRLDPPMWELLREAEQGNGILMVAYGYSGSGKTTTLIGDAEAPVGGAHGIDGVLSIYLRENSNRIKNVKMRVLEIYARFDGRDGRLMTEAGAGLWAYRLKSKKAEYLGPSTSFATKKGKEKGKTDFEKVDAAISSPEYLLDLSEVVSRSTNGLMDWGAEVKTMLTDIEKIRMDGREFKSGGEELAHIRATPNNPKSSRGSLIVQTIIEYNNGETGSVSVVDLAGAEDPAVLVEGFMSFFPSDGADKCIPKGLWNPGGPEGSSKKLTQKYMHEMDNYTFLDTDVAACARMRDFLVDCDRKKPKPECVDITLTSGKNRFVRPNTLADEAWTYKTFRPESEQLDFEFEIKGQKIVFTEAEVSAARKIGKVPGVSKLKYDSSLVGKVRCGPREDEKCQGSWVERLWGRCGTDEVGKCVRIGELDGILLGEKMKGEDYDFMRKGSEKKGADRTVQGIPKHVVTLSGSKKGKAFRRGKEFWKDERARFWREIHLYEAAYAKKEQDLADNWELHLQYFVKAVGPMVQESLLINEALNQMKSYFGTWAAQSIETPPGEPLHLWPVSALKDEAKNNQIIDTSPDSRYVKDGYDLYKFVKQHGADKSYAEMAGDGEDQVMLLTMLEVDRMAAVKRGKEAKVLFGAFVRTDQPGADPDCAGAEVSLEFAQSLSEKVGWKRGEALTHLM